METGFANAWHPESQRLAPRKPTLGTPKANAWHPERGPLAHTKPTFGLPKPTVLAQTGLCLAPARPTLGLPQADPWLSTQKPLAFQGQLFWPASANPWPPPPQTLAFGRSPESPEPENLCPRQSQPLATQEPSLGPRKPTPFHAPSPHNTKVPSCSKRTAQRAPFLIASLPSPSGGGKGRGWRLALAEGGGFPLRDCPSPRSTRSATLGGNKSQSNSRAKSTGAIG